MLTTKMTIIEKQITMKHLQQTDTLFENTAMDMQSSMYPFAHGGGHSPVFSKQLAEYLPFPTIFCRKARPSNIERL